MAKHRNRGDGSLHLRKDGRWEGRYVVGYDDKGLPVTKNVLAKTKSECAAKLAQPRETLKEPVPEQPKPGILLAAWLDLWYQGYKKPNLRPNTQMSYERRIYQHITPALGQIQLDKLTTADIQKFYADLNTKASFTVDTYTHTTTDMHEKAAEIVGGFLTDYLGEEMAPWQSTETAATAVST